MNPILMGDVVAVRNAQLMAEAERERLRRAARATAPTAVETLRRRVGAVLVRAGERVQGPVVAGTVGRAEPADLLPTAGLRVAR